MSSSFLNVTTQQIIVEPQLPCFQDPFHVYGISSLLNLIIVFIPEYWWPILSPPHTVYISWNISILLFHMYWIYQKGYNLPYIALTSYGIIVALFCGFFLVLTWIGHWLSIFIPALLVLVVWTYEADNIIAFMGLALCFLLLIGTASICYNIEWFIVSGSTYKNFISFINSCIIGGIASFSLRILMEQEPPQYWIYVGQTQICCTLEPSSLGDGTNQFSDTCPLAITAFIIILIIGFILTRILLNYCYKEQEPDNEQKQKQQPIQYIYVPIRYHSDNEEEGDGTKNELLKDDKKNETRKKNVL